MTMKKEAFNNFLKDGAEEYPIERYEVRADYVDNSYLFTLDYGTSISSSCCISEDGTIIVNCGELNIVDKNELVQRKADIIREILEPMFGEDAESLVENGIGKDSSAFKKAEEYVINNDKFVSYKSKSKEKDKHYEYRTVYDEGLESVSFYIKSKLFNDEVGIIIYSDDSFLPIISTAHINLVDEFKKQRLDAIKEFIYEVLKVKINFGTLDGIHGLRIKDLSKKAINYAKKKGTIEYTDDVGDIYLYKERPSDITSLNGIGSI